LGQGHAVFLSAGTHLYDVKIPMLEFSHALQVELGEVKIQRPPTAAKHDQWIKAHAFNEQGGHSERRLDGRVKGLFLQHDYRHLLSLSWFDETDHSSPNGSQGHALRQASAKNKFQNLAALRPKPVPGDAAEELKTLGPTDQKVPDA